MQESGLVASLSNLYAALIALISHVCLLLVPPPPPPTHKVVVNTPIIREPPPPTAPEDGKPLEQLLAHTQASFAASASARLGRGERLAKTLYRGYFVSAGDLGRAAAQPELLAALELGAALHGLCDTTQPLRFVGEARAPRADETEKYVLACANGEEVEMVAMPAPGLEASWSLCISSQVGCRMGCTFCETGRMGLLRNLSAAEIVAQVALAAHALRLRVSNVVFMGMGEPLDNVEAVIEAVRLLEIARDCSRVLDID